MYPEGSIAETYLEAKRTFYAHYYLGSDVLHVFETQGTAMGKERSRYLTDAEYIASNLYMLLNCDELKPYIGWVPP